MTLLMVTEVELKYQGNKWGVMVVDVGANGETATIGFRLAKDPARIRPFATLAIVEVPEHGPQLAFTLSGAPQKGVLKPDGSVHRTDGTKTP